MAKWLVASTTLVLFIMFSFTCVVPVENPDNTPTTSSSSTQQNIADTTPPGPCINFIVQSGSGKAFLSWLVPTDDDLSCVLIVRSDTAAVFEPEDGKNYSDGSTLKSTDGLVTGTVLGKTLEAYFEDAVSCDTVYFYHLIAYDTSLNYSVPVSQSFTQSHSLFKTLFFNDYTSASVSAIYREDTNEFSFVFDNKEQGNYDIFFMQASQYGVVDEESKVTINASSNFQVEPRLIWSGTEYGVVWTDYRKSESNPDIYFGKLDSNGNYIGDGNGNDELAICLENHEQTAPIICPNGDKYGIIWQDYRKFDYDVYYAQVDATGALQPPLDPPVGVAIVNTNDNELASGLIPTSTSEFAVFWLDARNVVENEEYTDIYYKKIDLDGTETQGELSVFTSSSEFSHLKVAKSGNTAAIAYAEKIDDLWIASSALVDLTHPTTPLIAGSTVQFNNNTATDQYPVDIQTTSDGSFIIAYNTFNTGTEDIQLVVISGTDGSILEGPRPVVNQINSDITPSIFYIDGQYSCIWNRLHTPTLNGVTSIFFTLLCP
jgi:hypothetical protein